MDDLEAVDYSADPLEGVSIWRSPNARSEGIYYDDFPRNYSLFSSGESSRSLPVILPDEPPTWPALSTPPHSPATIGFVAGCINPNPGPDHPAAEPVSRPPPNPNRHTSHSDPSGCFGPSSGSFTSVPPLSGPPPDAGFGLAAHQFSEPFHVSAPPAGQTRNPPPLSGPKKKSKCFKSKEDEYFLRLEEDIQWGEVMEFADCVLVGRIRGRNYTAARLKTWAAEVWGQHLVDIPVVQTFVRGWFALRFARADHTNWVLSSHWHFDQAPVLLKRWTSLFDPETEQIGVGPIWVRLPRLPLQYWSEDIFKRIGNALDTYMGYDKSFHQTGMMAYARILINMDTRGGLYEHITIQWRDSARKQIIDYEGIPYRCRRCHKVGHLYRDCPLLRKSQRNGTAVDTDPPQVPPPYSSTCSAS